MAASDSIDIVFVESQNFHNQCIFSRPLTIYNAHRYTSTTTTRTTRAVLTHYKVALLLGALSLSAVVIRTDTMSDYSNVVLVDKGDLPACYSDDIWCWYFIVKLRKTVTGSIRFALLSLLPPTPFPSYPTKQLGTGGRQGGWSGYGAAVLVYNMCIAWRTIREFSTDRPNAHYSAASNQLC